MTDEHQEGMEADGLHGRLDALREDALKADQDVFGGATESEYLPESEPQPEVPQYKSAEAMTVLVVAITSILAQRRGQHWKLAQDEAEALGNAYGLLLDIYLPAEKAGPIVGATMVSFAVFAPRLAMEKALSNERKARAKKKDTKQEPPAGSDDVDNDLKD